jgi:hypothetical protein
VVALGLAVRQEQQLTAEEMAETMLLGVMEAQTQAVAVAVLATQIFLETAAPALSSFE